MPMGTSWATNSWDEAPQAWANGTWAGLAGAPAAYGDLTFLFSGYLNSLAAAHAGADDPGTQIAHDLATVRTAEPGETDDANTLYSAYLST